jgi:transposase
MALVLTAVLALLIVEDAMPRRKTPPHPADPAAQALLATLHPHAAGIDVGAAELWVCVPPGSVPLGSVPPGQAPPEFWRGEVPDDTFERVRCFGSFTADLHAIAAWLRHCGVTTVALESTGVYWIPLYDLLQTEGFEVLLVDPRQTQRAPGRPKTDKHDCMWIQRLHGLGLLTAAFRPQESVRVWRSYQRHRANLVGDAARHLLRLEKALEQMNVKLTEVVSDITGLTAMSIVKAILAGQRDPRKLAALRDCRCKKDEATIALALQGTWRAEHLLELRHCLELYEYYHVKVQECDRVIEEHLKTMALPEVKPLPPRPRLRKHKDNEPAFDARQRLYQLAGVDLTAIEGIDERTALVVLSEVGTDMSRWPSERHFGSWLGLAPCPRKSGGKVLSSATRPGVNRAAQALRLGAKNLQRSRSALGAFFRRVAARRGLPKAITATAYKLGRIIYGMLRYGKEYAAQGMAEYEAAYRQRAVKNLRRKAKELGYELTPQAQDATAAPSGASA